MTQLGEVSQLSVEKVTSNIGATISGVDLAHDNSEETSRRIYQELLRHKVVFIPGQQHVDNDVLKVFAQRIGTLTKPHPTFNLEGDAALEIDSPHGRANWWHTDVTFVEAPPKISILRPVVLPPYGGTTCWANTAQAYSDLPQPLKLLAENLRGLHHNSIHQHLVDKAKETDPSITPVKLPFFCTEHPVVRVHPETGEKALLLGTFCTEFEGLDADESKALYNIFQKYVTTLENTVRWSWSLGDVVLWDNRSTQHYAVCDYDNAPRRMSRLTLSGDVPRGVDGRPSISHAGDASAYSIIDTHFPYALI